MWHACDFAILTRRLVPQRSEEERRRQEAAATLSRWELQCGLERNALLVEELEGRKVPPRSDVGIRVSPLQQILNFTAAISQTQKPDYKCNCTRLLSLLSCVGN